MSDINKVDLRLVDATILMVFLSLMRHRKATLAAAEIGLTQPAISHALKRLRALYGDELFLRRAHGLEPTALAHELEPKVRRIVRLISESLAKDDEFDPAKAQTTLRIAAFDYEHSTIIPELVTNLKSSSPGISIHTYPNNNRDALKALVDGQIDMAVGYFDFPSKGSDVFVVDELFHERYVVAARESHPLLVRECGLEQYAAAEYVMIAPYGPQRNMVDHAFQLKGYRRHVQTTVPSLFAALSIVEQTDLVVILPERVAARNARRFNLIYQSLPIDGGAFSINAVRHIRNERSAIHIWLVEQFTAASAEFLPSPS